MMFLNRENAAEQLAQALNAYDKAADTVVLGLPRGGVVTAAVVARVLSLPLDILVPRKIGAPFNPELAIGAVAEDGSVILDAKLITSFNIGQDYIDQTVAAEQKEAQRRLHLYRGGRPPIDLANKTAILVDDGIATGATMKAAIASAQTKKATTIVVAVPVTPPETISVIESMVDEFVYLSAPADFGAVGVFYRDFPQTSDEEVIALLAQE